MGHNLNYQDSSSFIHITSRSFCAEIYTDRASISKALDNISKKLVRGKKVIWLLVGLTQRNRVSIGTNYLCTLNFVDE